LGRFIAPKGLEDSAQGFNLVSTPGNKTVRPERARGHMGQSAHIVSEKE